MINPLKMQEMLSQANQMQEEMQRKLGETVVEATSGGGAVTRDDERQEASCSSFTSTRRRW